MWRRITPDGQTAQLKWNVALGEAACAEGGTTSGAMTKGGGTAPIRNKAFDYVTGSIEFHGRFDTATTASGTFKIKFEGCTVGPLGWTAAAK